MRVRLPSLLLILGLGIGTAYADERRITAHAEAFVEAFNDGGDEAINAFVEQHSVPVDPNALRKVIAQHRDQGGVLERPQVRVIGNGGAVFVTARRPKSGSWESFQFTVDRENEDRIRLVFISQALEPFEPPSFDISDPALPDWLDGFVARLARTQPFYGAIAIRHGDEIVYHRAFGQADVGNHEANTLETRFNMASGSKMFTAIAVMQLIEQGSLALTDPVSRHVPETAGLPQSDTITIRHLLNHTSGIGDYWDTTYEAAWGDILEHDALLPHVLRNWGEPLPGTLFEYSNSNYALLGLIVERASGSNFYEYVQKNVFDRAGMTQTGYPIRNEAQGLAQGYNPVMDAGQIAIDRHAPVVLGARGSGAGGASTTVGDMLTFDTALRNGKLVSPQTLAQMQTMQSASRIANYGYGYGFIIDGGHYGHGGSAPGVQFEFERFDEQDVTIVVTSNFNTIAGPEIAQLLGGLVEHQVRR